MVARHWYCTANRYRADNSLQYVVRTVRETNIGTTFKDVANLSRYEFDEVRLPLTFTRGSMKV